MRCTFCFKFGFRWSKRIRWGWNRNAFWC